MRLIDIDDFDYKFLTKEFPLRGNLRETMAAFGRALKSQKIINEWTPVNKEMPKESGWHEVTTYCEECDLRYVEFLYYDIDKNIWEFAVGGEGGCDMELMETCNMVIAWKPSSKPYKSE